MSSWIAIVFRLPVLSVENVPYAAENGRGSAGLLSLGLFLIALLATMWMIQKWSGKNLPRHPTHGEERWPDS